MAWAEHEFRQTAKRSDGASQRDHAESAARQFAKLGRKPKRATAPKGPRFPDALAYLWRHFVEVMQGVTVTGMGPAIVTWRDLQAWCDMTGNRLERWEALALVRLGALRADVLAAQMQTTTPPPKGAKG